MRAVILARRRSWIVLGMTLSAIGLTFVPLSTGIAIPAIVEDRDIEAKHARRPAYVLASHVRQGESVQAGRIMVELAAPDLDHQIEQTRLRLALVARRLERRSADLLDRQDTLIFESSPIFSAN